jgi:hypothetical protein
MTLYDMNSSATYDSQAHVIPANESYTFLAVDDTEWTPTLPDGFIGSAVVSSDQPILAIVNEQNNLSPGGIAGGSYRGFTSDDTSTRLLFPLVKNDFGGSHNTTTFFVQNASSTAADIYATFRVAAGTYSQVYSGVEPGDMVTVNPSDAGVPTGSTSLGSLEITSTVELAGIYNEHPHSVATVATTLLGTTGFAEAAADTTLYVPIFKMNYNTTYGGIQVQNVGSVATTVYATYTVAYGGSGSYYYNLSAPAGESVTFFNVPGWPSSTFGAVEVSADQPLVAIVNETKYSTGQAGVYAAYPASQVQNCAVAPLWKTRWSGGSSGQQSTIVVQNVGSVAASVDITFTMTLGGVGVFTPPTVVVPAGESAVYGPGPITSGPPSGTPAVGSVLICADQPIAVLVQETTLPGWTLRDMMNYEAFPR